MRCGGVTPDHPPGPNGGRGYIAIGPVGGLEGPAGFPTLGRGFLD